MAAIPGSVPLTGKVAPTDTTDTFATHMDIYGEGGYMSVADTAARNLITEDRRKLGMAVCTTTDNKIYTLTTEPGGATTIDANWTEFSSGGNPDLQDILDEGTDASNLPYSGAVYSTSDSLGFLPTNSVVIGNGDLPTGEAAYVGCIYNASPMHNSVNIWAQHDTSVSNNDGRVLLYAKNANGTSELKLHSGEIEFTIDGSPAVVGKVLTCSSTDGTAGEVEWQPGVQTTKVSLSNAEIQALDVTPIELVAAPGAGKFIQLLSVYGFLDYTAPAFNSVFLNIRTSGDASYMGQFATAFTSASADTKGTWYPRTANALWNDNTKIEIGATGATGAGGSTLDLYLTYIIIDS